MNTAAHPSMTRQARAAFDLALPCAAAIAAVRAMVLCKSAVQVRVSVVVAVIGSVMKRHASRHISSVCRFIGFNWKRGNSIRGASPLVANG